MNFFGYARKDGTFGVRNHLVIVPTVFCGGWVARKIASMIPGSQCLNHPVGCSQVGYDLELTAHTLKRAATSPNVGAVLVVGLGCERFKASELAEAVAASGRPVETVIIQEEGSSVKALQAGVRLGTKLLRHIQTERRVEAPLASLAVGLECGGTDATSGIAANPTLGRMSDKLISRGGSAIFSETTELLGAEHILASRAVNEKVAAEILSTIARTEEYLARATADEMYAHRSALISTGNFDGGVTTVAEKALGNIHKAGTQPIKGVLGFGERPTAPGLYLMDTPGQDAESVTGLVAGGCQVVVFTTGRGTPTGSPLAPVIKVTGNAVTYSRMADDIDFSAAGIIDGTESLEEAGERLLREVLEVASGKKVKAEWLGHDELFAVPRALG